MISLQSNIVNSPAPMLFFRSINRDILLPVLRYNTSGLLVQSLVLKSLTLFVIFLKSYNVSSHQLNSIPKIMVQFCYLRLYVGTETVSCRLLLRMARMDVD